MAVRALDDACSHHKNLDLLIRLRPNLDHLGEAGSPLLLRFLSTSKGFQHLHDISYIEGEMDEWFMVRSISHCHVVSVDLVAYTNHMFRRSLIVCQQAIYDPDRGEAGKSNGASAFQPFLRGWQV